MADYKGLNIRFRGDTTDASKALHILSSEAKAAQGNLTGINNSLKNAETNGKSLNDALKQLQLEQVGKQAEAARGRVGVLGQSLVDLQKNLAGAQQKLAENKATLEGMPEKYGELARVASSAFEQVRQAQDALSEASQRAEFAPNQQAYVQAVNDQVTAQNQLNAAIAAGDEAFTQRAAQYGTIEGAINSAEEAEREYSAAIDSTKEKILAADSAAKAYEAQHTAMSAALAASQIGLGQFGANATTVGDNLKTVGDALSSVGDKMTIVSGIAAVTFGRNIVSSTEEFGNAIAQLGGYLDIGGTELDGMREQALKWGKDTQFSATEAANAMNELAKGGMTQAQISGGAMEATMQLAAAGSLDMAQAASVAVQAIKTFGLDAKDASAIADALAGAANKSTAEVTELANGFKYVGGWASMAGWNINDVSGALALLSDHGLQSEMAGTALRNVMQRLAAPTDTAAKLMSAYGFSVRDAQGKMVSATEVVQRLNDTFGGLADEEKQNVLNDIFGARALPAAIALMDEGAESLQGYIDATTEVGYAGEMAQNRMGELGWALEYLRGEAETAAVNFGQALAPAIIDVAKAIEGALEWFNSLSEAERTNIANMALMVTAAGPVISIVGHLASGIGGVVSAIGTGATTISTFAQLMKDGGDATKLFAEAMAMSTTAFDGTAKGMQKVAATATTMEQGMANLAKGGVVALVAVLIADLASQLIDYVTHEQEFERATSGLHSAIENLGKASASSSGGVSDMTRSLSEIRDASRDLNSAQAEIAESLRQVGTGASEDTMKLDQYMSTIGELTGKSNLTAGEQERLKKAVDDLNGILNTSVSVVNAQTGELNTNYDTLLKVTDAYKKYAEVQATMDAYSKVQQQIIENQIEMERLQNELNNADKGVGWYIGDFAVFSDFGGVADKYHELEKSMQQARDRSDELAFAQQNLEGRINGATTSTDEYNSMLEAMGLNANKTGQDLGDVGDDAEDAAQRAAQAATDAKEAIKQQNDAIYREQQRTYDREYKAQQKAYDQEYKAIQKQLDAVYKERQKAFDREYKEAQKAYDREYDERQKQLDSEYEAAKDAYDREYDALKSKLDKDYKERQEAYDREYESLKSSLDKEYKERQKSYDSAYDALKSALDKEYKERQKSYDSAYDALKKSLDTEYKLQQDSYAKEYDDRKKQLDGAYSAYKSQLDSEESAFRKSLDSKASAYKKELDSELSALKKANDARLKEQKKADEAETKAFKAETDKRVAALQAEYKERLKALELQYGGSDIDARIKSLKNQTKAEQAEIKRREQQEKKAELERAVAQAKTRRARADAEEKLNDYLAELAQEQRENEREAQIEQLEDRKQQLKEELSAKKDALKTEYDDRIAALKDQRAAELEVTKEANDLEYEALREQLDGVYQARKEANDLKLEQIKESNQAEVDSLKEHHQTLLDSMKDRHTLELEQLKEQQSERLESIKEDNQAQLESLKEGNQQKLDALKDSNQRQLDALKESQQTQLANLKDSQQQQLNDLKSGQQEQLSALKDSQQKQLDSLKSNQEQRLGVLKASHKQQLDSLKESQQSQLESMKDGQQQQLEALKDAHQSQLEELKSAQQEQLQELKYAQQDQLQALKNSLDNAVNAMVSGGKSISDAAGNAARQTTQNMANGLSPMPTDTGNTARQTLRQYLDNINDMPWSTEKLANTTGHTLVERLNAHVMPTTDASKALRNAALRNIEGLPEEGRQKGDGMGSNLASGIGGKEGETRSAAERLKSAAGNPLSSLPYAAGQYGTGTGSSFASGIGQGGDEARRTAQEISRSVSNSFSSPANNSARWGWDMLNNFNGSIVDYWNSTLSRNIQNIAQGIQNMLGHSTPKEGPLKGDDQWFYHLMQNLDEGLRRGTPMLMGTVADIADGMADGMDVDPVGDLIENMRSNETALASQSRRMAEIVSEEFNPYASANYSVGYDVKPMARLLTNGVTEALRSGIPQRSGPTIVVREMHVRKESDIDRISERLYARERQAVRRGW